MVFRRELKGNLKGLLIWSAALGGLVLLMMSVFPSFAADAEAAEQMMAMFPEAFKNVFGMDTLNIGTYTGYYGLEVHLINTLVGSVYAALLAAGILAKEENDRTADFLLSKPVTRTEVAVQKLAAVLANLLFLDAVIAAVSFACTGFAEEAADIGILVWYLVATFLLHVTFASVSFLLSAVMRRTRSVVSLSLGIVFLSYALSVMAGLSDRFGVLRRVSFFSFVDAASIVESGGLSPGNVLAMALASLLCSAGAVFYYRYKDIAG